MGILRYFFRLVQGSLSVNHYSCVRYGVSVGLRRSILKRIIELLGDDPSTSFVEALDESSLPTNSDALLILKQFKTALSKFHALRYSRTELGWDWNVKD